ncbi:MAG TPA: LysM peptidoglycan-binding domain-containing protein [Candidatus Dormibacteraeota bacterium]
MYAAGRATRLQTPLRSDRTLRRFYRWALVLVAALAVMLALSRVAQGGTAATTVVVQPGDTLWTIAANRYPGDDTRARVDDIERLNDLSGPLIVVGETLRLPA